MKVSFTIETTDQASIDAALELAKKLAGDGCGCTSCDKTPTEDSAAEKPAKPKKSRATKPPKTKDGELSSEEQNALDDMDEAGLREEVKRLVPEYKAKIGLAKLKGLVKDAGGFDGKNTKLSLIPEENLVDTIRQMTADLEEA
jgi:hypothetical protein